MLDFPKMLSSSTLRSIDWSSKKYAASMLMSVAILSANRILFDVAIPFVQLDVAVTAAITDSDDSEFSIDDSRSTGLDEVDVVFILESWFRTRSL